MGVLETSTRRPERLLEASDEPINLRTAKSWGPEDLHPSPYNRGGRLQDIASIQEASKLASLEYQGVTYEYQGETYPEKTSPRRARRHGDLGFQPGSWWVDTWCACLAGIIDVDTVKGGICYDQYGAYAIVLVEDRLDAPPKSMTYRCSKDDRGKYNLTAASPRSREPIRVLRSYRVNSMCCSKAGVRYDGLYRVTGWAIHHPTTFASIMNQEVCLSNMNFDVRLERCDPVPPEEVAGFPAASELYHRDLHEKAIPAPLDTIRVLPDVSTWPAGSLLTSLEDIIAKPAAATAGDMATASRGVPNVSNKTAVQ